MNAKTILYIEDNELNRKIVRVLLKSTSYTMIFGNWMSIRIRSGRASSAFATPASPSNASIRV